MKESKKELLTLKMGHNKLKQLAKTRELKNAILTLNTKVDKSVYLGNGLYTLKRVNKELELYPNI